MEREGEGERGAEVGDLGRGMGYEGSPMSWELGQGPRVRCWI